MRNLFDQFQQPENRLTHALTCSLSEDPELLAGFIPWAIGELGPSGELQVVEQTLPGEEQEEEDLPEAQRRGLPDGWIFNQEGWALLIESKIECRLEADQIRRHCSTAQKRGFTQIYTLALVTNSPEHGVHPELKIRRWAELYLWLKTYTTSEWAKRLSNYMEILEVKLVKEGYLKTGPLTVFTGIDFGTEKPYSYLEAKRLLHLAMDELRPQEALSAIGVDRDAPGRAAITGRDSSAVWDYLRLVKATGAKNFTEFPHLTLGLHRDYLHAIVIVPNGLRSDLRRNLLGHGYEAFRTVFSDILKRYLELLGNVEGAVPWVEVVQRRYPSQRSEPFRDALQEFDLRTAFPPAGLSESWPKLQPQWLQCAYEALRDRNANLQLAAGVRFYYDRCPDAGTRKILSHIGHAWISCTPLIDTITALETCK